MENLTLESLVEKLKLLASGAALYRSKLEMHGYSEEDIVTATTAYVACLALALLPPALAGLFAG